jgi:hypothetical protein
MEGKLLRYRLKLKYGTQQQGWGDESGLYLGKRWENSFDFKTKQISWPRVMYPIVFNKFIFYNKYFFN